MIDRAKEIQSSLLHGARTKNRFCSGGGSWLHYDMMMMMMMMMIGLRY